MRQLLSSLGKLLRFHDAMTRLSCDEARVLEQRPVETEQRRDAADQVLVESAQHPPPRGLPVARDPPGSGQKAVRRILGVDPALDRVSGQPDVVLAQR